MASSSSIMHFVYMLRCADNSLYIGETDNIDDRLSRHQEGRACSSTARRLPVPLVYVEEVANHLEGRRREHQLKGWTRRKKEALIAGDLAALFRAERHRGRKPTIEPCARLSVTIVPIPLQTRGIDGSARLTPKA